MEEVFDRKKNLILKEKNLYKSIVILALPVFFSNLLKSIHSFVDMYFISPLGDNAISSIQLTNPIIMISIALAMGFMIAGIAIMSQAIGAKNIDSAKKIGGQLLVLCIISGIILNIVIFLSAPLLVRMVAGSGEEQTVKYALDYVRMRSFELVPLFTFFAFHASRQASGDTVTPVIYNIIAIVINIFLTGYFVRGLNLEVAGAALATVIGNAIIVPFYLVMMFKDKKADVSLSLDDLKLKPYEMKKIVSLGIPSAIAQGFTSLGFLILNSLILYYFSESTLSAFSVGNNINSLILMPAMGIGGVIPTFVGQNIGANNPKRARKSVKSALILSSVFMTLGGLALLPFRYQLGGIFLKDNYETLSLSVEYMFFLFTSLPLMAIFQVFMGAYQGAGYTKFSMILAILRLWGMRVPMVLIFKGLMDLDSSSIWYAMVISNFGATIIGVILYRLIRFDHKIKLSEE
ncbi:MAG TPA: MATE family efflux transporter [Acholeplasmataceae bacterium]|nr:MATE family efflux transporter [Acholeplasmataceae bacterium]